MNNSNFKKTLIFIILAAMLIAIPISCNRAANTTSGTNPISSPTASKTPQKSENSEAAPTPSLTASPTPTVSRAQVEYYMNGDQGIYLPVKEISEEEAVKIIEETSKTQEEELKIPVYSGNQLLLGKYKLVEGQYNCTWPGFDNSNPLFGGSNNKSAGILSSFPDGAWRDMEDGRKYVMYDTDTGTRLYIFFTEHGNYRIATGYTLYSVKKLSYSDMKPLKMGQTIDDVIAIDPTAQYVKVLYDRLPNETIKDYNDYFNQPINTVHLLTDGIMKFTYELGGEKGNYTYTIVDIEYHSDFKMQGLAGVTDYRIAEVDYVNR